MFGSVVLRSGGTSAIESPGNAVAWMRTRLSAALAKLARDEVHLEQLKNKEQGKEEARRDPRV
jgi:hypothetical protein